MREGKFNRISIDIKKLYPNKIKMRVLLAPCCISYMKYRTEVYCDPHNDYYHTYECIEKEIGFIKIHFHPNKKHKSGLTFKERKEQLMDILENQKPAKYIGRGDE